jgi:hypothetical protein
VHGLYESHTAKKSQHAPVWLNDRPKAIMALNTLDEKLEAHVISGERYKERTKTHEGGRNS